MDSGPTGLFAEKEPNRLEQKVSGLRRNSKDNRISISQKPYAFHLAQAMRNGHRPSERIGLTGSRFEKGHGFKHDNGKTDGNSNNNNNNFNVKKIHETEKEIARLLLRFFGQLISLGNADLQAYGTDRGADTVVKGHRHDDDNDTHSSRESDQTINDADQSTISDVVSTSSDAFSTLSGPLSIINNSDSTIADTQMPGTAVTQHQINVTIDAGKDETDNYDIISNQHLTAGNLSRLNVDGSTFNQTLADEYSLNRADDINTTMKYDDHAIDQAQHGHPVVTGGDGEFVSNLLYNYTTKSYDINETSTRENTVDNPETILSESANTMRVFGKPDRRLSPIPTDRYPYNTTLDHHEDYFLFWEFNDTTITFEVHVRTYGYVGFGLSLHGGMYPADVFVGWIDNGRPYFAVSISIPCKIRFV